MIQIITLIINLVNYYLMTATNKRLLISESHGDSNWCTPCRGKPDQHDMYAFHASPRMPGICFLRVVPIRDNLSWVTDRVGRILLLPIKNAPDSTPQPSWVTYGIHLSLSSNIVIEVVGLTQAPVNDRLLGLLGPYHRHTISTFSTCSRVPTSQSLTDIGGGYHIENLRIATKLSPPFPFEGSTDPPKWPCPVSIFIHINIQG
jgi:hypothetical protein